MKFNVLVTTYEFVMFDRSKLSRVDWKYIIIDEAQRMKDRDSVLARDLDRYRCQRRLLLTGTPLQVNFISVYYYCCQYCFTVITVQGSLFFFCDGRIPSLLFASIANLASHCCTLCCIYGIPLLFNAFGN